MDTRENQSESGWEGRKDIIKFIYTAHIHTLFKVYMDGWAERKPEKGIEIGNKH